MKVFEDGIMHIDEIMTLHYHETDSLVDVFTLGSVQLHRLN